MDRVRPADLSGDLQLHRAEERGEPQGHFEYTTALVTDGAYGCIRRPMYASLFLLATGVALKQPTDWSAIVVFAVHLTAKAEE